MLKKFINSTNNKGDGKMNSKNSLLRMTMAVAGAFLIGVMLVTGCGGANSTSGAGVAITPTNTTASGTSTITYGAIEGRVVSLGSGGNVDEIPVVLEKNSVVIATTKTITSGAYYFDKVPFGTYVVKINASTSYSQTAVLTTVNADKVLAEELQLVSSLKITDIPTTNISGFLIAALDGTGLSVSQIELDSGYKTVTDAFGAFSLPNVASGSRKMEISKGGASLYSIAFTVNSTDGKTVNKVSYNGTDYFPTATGTSLGQIALTYNLTSSAMLTGTVLQYQLLPNGKPTSTKTTVPGFAFELWMVPSSITTPYTKIGLVVTGADGSFKLDNLPILPRTLMAVATGTFQVAVYDLDGEVTGYVLRNTNAPWVANPDFSFTSHYSLSASSTTVMDITLPVFQSW